MNEDQAQTIIDLLSEISDKLSTISEKITHDKDHNTVNDKLTEIVSELSSIKYNTKV